MNRTYSGYCNVAVAVDKDLDEWVTLMATSLQLPALPSLSLLLTVAHEASVVAQKDLIAVQDVMWGVSPAGSGELGLSGVEFVVTQHFDSQPCLI
jgi:hypothetical protein